MPAWIFIDISGSPRKHEQLCVCRFELSRFSVSDLDVVFSRLESHSGPSLVVGLYFPSLTNSTCLAAILPIPVSSLDGRERSHHGQNAAVHAEQRIIVVSELAQNSGETRESK